MAMDKHKRRPPVLLVGWQRRSTADLQALLDTLPDDTAAWDAVADEIEARQDTETPADSPSVQDAGDLPTYGA